MDAALTTVFDPAAIETALSGVAGQVGGLVVGLMGVGIAFFMLMKAPTIIKNVISNWIG